MGHAVRTKSPDERESGATLALQHDHRVDTRDVQDDAHVIQYVMLPHLCQLPRVLHVGGADGILGSYTDIRI